MFWAFLVIWTILIQELHDATRGNIEQFFLEPFKITTVSQNIVALFTRIARRRY